MCLLSHGAKACLKRLELMVACDLECFKKQSSVVKCLPARRRKGLISIGKFVVFFVRDV